MFRSNEASWSNPKVLSTLALIFLCGGVVGAGIMRATMHSRLKQPTHVAVPVIERAQRLGLSGLSSKLDLSPQQEQAINRTLDDYGKFYQNIEEEREDTARVGMEQILKVLTPEQQKRFRSMMGVTSP